jgi:2-succinyl-5-enolpyruvyl-6-hydroxy-3-cyclohexene-1-carboxylate synthase
MSTSTDLARSYIRYFIEQGVSHFVLSPGSRNAPLSIALNEAAEKGIIELHVKIDERGAAFFALGLSKASENYVALICTSGTAVANYAPAALEALHSGNKLLLITADRPSRLRNTGANQTTNQVNIFQDIPTFDLAIFEPVKLNVGPVHLNLQFDEPLLPSDSNNWLEGLHISTQESQVSNREKLKVSGNGLVIVGHDKGGFTPVEIENFAENLVIISEDPLSFKSGIAHSSIFLADEKVREYLKADYVIVIGRTTLSRSINAFIGETKIQYVVDKLAKTIDSKRTGTKIFENLPELDIQDISENYRRDFELASKNTEVGLVWSEQKFAEILGREIPEDSALFVGSSRPIRDIEGFAQPRSGLRVFANRGLAGIDGNISTIFGIAEENEITYAVLGDLTFLHDVSALISPTESNCKIFVINNGGGGIFSTLPQAGVNGFEKIFGTPHNQNISKIISGFGIENEVIKSESDLKRAITHPVNGFKVFIVEVPSREDMAKNLKDIYARASNAVRIGFNLA